MSDQSGKVGSEATLVIISENRPIHSDYYVYWGMVGEDEELGKGALVEGNQPEKVSEITIYFIVPEVPYKAGGYILSFYSQTVNPEGGAAYSLLFKVEPDLKTSPSSASPGMTVIIKGTGLAASDDIDLSFDGEVIDMDIETSSLGSFTAEFTVPDAIAGTHEFKAIPKRFFVGEITASLEVVPSISLEPEFPEIGSELTINGCGFAASSNVSVSYDGVTISSSPISDELGNLSYVFNVPESSESEHEIVVTDAAGNAATWSLPLEGEAPEAPTPVSPQGERFGWFGSQVVAFAWLDVTDASGVTYTLEIANNLNFFPLAPGMRKTELAQTSCLVNLEPGTYYWRVRAVDGAGNESEWTLSPYSFRVGFFSIWYLLFGGFIFLLVFLFIIRAFFRRISEYYK